MDLLKNICPNELAVLSVAIAIILAEVLSTDELNVLSNFFAGLGGNMATIATQQAYLQTVQSLQEQNNCLNQQIDVLKNQIKMLQNKGGR